MQELYNLPEPENCNIRVVTRNKDNQRIIVNESLEDIGKMNVLR
ncbi:MAG: hypothetical protein N4A72_21090 [Bacteroidales bacterium]|jgi:hypothetical protein|nr:hypothetical protein [Bacteroidales bacterium]